ncbi:MAG TPA: hypothetical protein VLM85_23405 [Polyangiaceae bacterium]|nr:hypothetical protein [Polyangiaceae bacterium]
MQSTHTTGSTNDTRSQASRTTLEDLARMDDAELARLYAAGGVPDHLRALDGDLRGRMLAVKLLDRGPIARAIAAFSSGRKFPWAGKSFTSDDATHGKGINRIRLWGRHRLFPFETSIGKSVIDGAPAVVLDYDLVDNPAAIRAMHDEVREVAPGLFLGPGCLKRRSGPPVVVLWFALDTARVH